MRKVGRPAKKVRVIIRREERMQYVIDNITDYYDTTVDDILAYHRSRVLSDRKRIAVKLMKDIGDCPPKSIASFFRMSEEWASKCYTTLNEDLYGNNPYSKELKQTYKELTNKILYETKIKKSA